jgi:hypothetical protein
MASRRCEDGSLSAFVIVLASTFMACAGLALDGGRYVATHVELADHAGNAARRGVQEVTSLRSGDPKVDRDRAIRAAQMYLSTHKLEGEVVALEQSVTVTVSESVQMVLLSLFGVNAKRLSVQRTATPVAAP